jgi:hypothetical protein
VMAAPLSLTENAQSELDRYLRRVRSVLRAHPAVDGDEIERDIRGHIDAELAASPAPITEVRLRAVLDRLGSPSQWVPAEDLPIWRTALIRLRSGPEDWRLAYASFVLFVAGPLVAGAIGVLLFLASVLLSRAALELLAEEDEPVGARRWLLYPPLLVIYLGLLAVILLAPPAMLETPIRAEAVGWFPDPFWATLLFVGVVAGAWWISLGLALTQWHGAVRATFRPFADWFERRHAVRLAYVGLGLLALASAALVIVAR